MAKVTPHFSWSEVEDSPTARKYGISNFVPENLRQNAICLAQSLGEPLRYLTGQQIGNGEVGLQVNSWYRCLDLNKVIKGEKSSAHTSADAFDLEPMGFDRLVMWPVVLRMIEVGFPIDQAVIYEAHSHIHIGQAYREAPRREALVCVAAAGTNGAAPHKSYVYWADYTGPLKGA